MEWTGEVIADEKVEVCVGGFDELAGCVDRIAPECTARELFARCGWHLKHPIRMGCMSCLPASVRPVVWR
jgi:hypothetical protein